MSTGIVPVMHPGVSPVEIPIDSIQATFFVRKALDEDRVVQLSLLIEGGTALPPIRVTDDRQLIDGRHRVEAYRLSGWTTIPAIIEPRRDKGELIADAFASNCGGSVPPTRADILFTIQQLLQQGWGRGRIIKALPFPKSVSERYIDDTQSKIRQSQINQAIIDIRDRGFTLAQAAANRGLTEEAIKAKMNAKGKRIAGSEEYKGNMSTRFRSLSRTNAALFQKLLTAYEDGEINIDYVRDVMNHCQTLHAQSLRSFESWRTRLSSVLDSERKLSKAATK
jgi:hypothetical protein